MLQRDYPNALAPQSRKQPDSYNPRDDLRISFTSSCAVHISAVISPVEMVKLYQGGNCLKLPPCSLTTYNAMVVLICLRALLNFSCHEEWQWISIKLISGIFRRDSRCKVCFEDENLMMMICIIPERKMKFAVEVCFEAWRKACCSQVHIFGMGRNKRYVSSDFCVEFRCLNKSIKNSPVSAERVNILWKEFCLLKREGEEKMLEELEIQDNNTLNNSQQGALSSFKDLILLKIIELHSKSEDRHIKEAKKRNPRNAISNSMEINEEISELENYKVFCRCMDRPIFRKRDFEAIEKKETELPLITDLYLASVNQIEKKQFIDLKNTGIIRNFLKYVCFRMHGEKMIQMYEMYTIRTFEITNRTENAPVESTHKFTFHEKTKIILDPDFDEAHKTTSNDFPKKRTLKGGLKKSESRVEASFAMQRNQNSFHLTGENIFGNKFESSLISPQFDAAVKKQFFVLGNVCTHLILFLLHVLGLFIPLTFDISDRNNFCRAINSYRTLNEVKSVVRTFYDEGEDDQKLHAPPSVDSQRGEL